MVIYHDRIRKKSPKTKSKDLSKNVQTCALKWIVQHRQLWFLFRWFSFSTLGFELLDDIQPLWLGLNSSAKLGDMGPNILTMRLWMCLKTSFILNEPNKCCELPIWGRFSNTGTYKQHDPKIRMIIYQNFKHVMFVSLQTTSYVW